jgi:glutamyl-Q tRNA(Asp) synthetase
MGGYRGRFAPTPSGDLHLGSLVAALASYLDARAAGGRWLIRMEDLDSPRNQPGAAKRILASLERLGLVADEPVFWQSERQDSCRNALERLRVQGKVYRCICSRSELSGPYPGTCRAKSIEASQPGSWRLRLPEDSSLAIDDQIQGHYARTTKQIGDPVLWRRDDIPAYQLSVVVDDLAQGITHIVRGADLLESTLWQLAVYDALEMPAPEFAHVPLLTEADGTKLAKSRSSQSLLGLEPSLALWCALFLLEQQPPQQLKNASVLEILRWGCAHWSLRRLQGISTQRLSALLGPESPTE